MKKRYYYLYLADLLQGYPRVKWVSDTPIKQYQQQAEEGIALCEYRGETLPERLVYDPKKKCCRTPTEQEKYELAPGQYQPPAGYYVKSGKVNIQPSMPAMLQPQFDIESERWIEIATREQVARRDERAKAQTYLNELECYGYARSEHALGLITDAALGEATAYLQTLAEKGDATRPALFNRYIA
ncbi:hypothetical protein [Aeromonas enterica]|jgi:hypothetical protein